MPRFLRTLAHWSAATVLLISITPVSGVASDCCCSCQQPHRWHDYPNYTRETNHGLIHYPGATYWSSWAPPSPWAYSSIAPYSWHYHFFYGDSYGGCFDCRN